MSYEDKTIVCIDCGAEFVFTGDEQQLFADKGFTNEPKRCKTCREARKASQTSGNRTGGNVSSQSGGGAGGGGRRSHGGGGGGGGRGGYGRAGGGGGGGGGGPRSGSAGPRQMFPATCASCGQQTQVPFKPTGSRPVYCRDCFQSQRASSGGNY